MGYLLCSGTYRTEACAIPRSPASVEHLLEHAGERVCVARPAGGDVGSVADDECGAGVGLAVAGREHDRPELELPAGVAKRVLHLVLDVGVVRAVVAPELPEGEQIATELLVLREAGRP